MYLCGNTYFRQQEMKKMFGNVLQQWTEFTGQGQANLYDRHRAIVPPILIERMITFLKEKVINIFLSLKKFSILL